MKRLVIVLGGAFFLFQMSCTTMTTKDCSSENWYSHGQRDALKGEGADLFAKHIEACKKPIASEYQEQYLAGFAESLKYFCGPQRGYDFAVSGGTYKNTCPIELQQKFIEGYERGKEAYELKSRLRVIESEIDELSANMVDPSLATAQRTRAAFDLREKEQRKLELQKRLSVLETKKN